MFHIYTHPYSPISQNTYLLYNDNSEAIIIDPGCYYPEEKDHFAQIIADKKLAIKQILLTHCHLDHVFGLAWAAEKYGLMPQYHPLEEKILAGASTSGLMFNLPFVNYNGAYKPLNEGQIITLGADELELLLLPGHTPGSIGFYCKAQNFIIAGDVLFYQSIGRTDLPGGNFEILKQSIQQKLFKLPVETKVYNGHGQPTTIQHEKEHNPFVSVNA